MYTMEDVQRKVAECAQKYNKLYDWCEFWSNILCEIGNESLNPSKKTGNYVGYRGKSVEEWEQIEGKRPFFIKDHITGNNHPDPRVVFIGEIFNQAFRDGLAAMQELYYTTGEKFHGQLWNLESAWNGIGSGYNKWMS